MCCFRLAFTLLRNEPHQSNSFSSNYNMSSTTVQVVRRCGFYSCHAVLISKYKLSFIYTAIPFYKANFRILFIPLASILANGHFGGEKLRTWSCVRTQTKLAHNRPGIKPIPANKCPHSHDTTRRRAFQG